MKIDRITQIVDITDSSIERYKTNNYELKLQDNNKGVLITNPGKILNDRINLGAYPACAKKIISKIHQDLGVTFIQNKTIEYCIDIETNFKLINHKNIINTFREVLTLMNYRSGKLDIDNSSDTTIQNCSWKGIKGYKSGRTLKLYSKACEKMIDIGNKDIIRIELCLNKKPLYQNKINDITNTTKANEEFLMLVKLWKGLMPKKKNKYTIPSFFIIEKLEHRIVI